MTDMLEVIFKRRSIRKYTDQAVDQDMLVSLLQAGMAAPTAANSQPWEFVVVTEAEILDELKANLTFGRYNAPAAIVVCGNPGIGHNSAGKRFWIQDCSAAIENILIAATAMGLGTVWIGVYPLESLVAQVRNVLGIPEQVIPLGVVYVGHPDEEKPPRTQYDPQRVYWQSYAPRKRRPKVKNAKYH